MKKVQKQGIKKIIVSSVALSMLASSFLFTVAVKASSHREAPFIASDPCADATDLYAFVSPEDPDTVTLVANYLPMEIGASGPNFYKFCDDVLYEINVDNNGDAKEDRTLQFRFWSETMTKDTFLYNTGEITSLGDEHLNQRQYYSVSTLKKTNAHRKAKVIKGAEKLQVAPANVGPKSYPEGYTKVAQQAVHTLDNGMKVFAGPREDPFFVDLGGAFDLLLGMNGNDYIAGLNVYTIAIQVPKKLLTSNGKAPKDETDSNAIIGVRTTSYRKSTSVLRPVTNKDSKNFKPKSGEGRWVQISRLGAPLINELVIPLKDKDRWNGSLPKNDGQFLGYVTDPELAGLMTALLGVNTPPAPRNDLVTIFLTGVEGLNQPKNVVASEQLRLNMGVEPTKSPNRLGVLAGDNAGFPNGRRLADDITDIALQAVAGGTAFTPDYNKAPNNALADGVDANEQDFSDSFPYMNPPFDYTGKNK